MKKIFFLLFPFILIFSACSGSGTFEKRTSEELDIKELYNYGLAFFSRNQIDDAEGFLLQAYEEASLIDHVEYRIKTLTSLSKLYFVKNDFDNALKSIEKIETISEGIKNNVALALRVEYFYHKGMYDLSIQTFLSGSWNVNEIYYSAKSFYILSLVNTGKINLSLLKTLKEEIQTEINDETLIIQPSGNYYYAFGYAYYKIDQFNDAKEYFEKALKIDKEQNNFSGTASSLFALGNCEKQLKDYKKAANYFERASAVFQSLLMLEEYEESLMEMLVAQLNIESGNKNLRNKLFELKEKTLNEKLKNKISKELENF